MSDINVDCPHCHRSFKLNETLAAPLVEQTRRSFEREFAEKEQVLEERRRAFEEEKEAGEKARLLIEAEREALAKKQEQLDKLVRERVEEQRAAIVREEAKKAQRKLEEAIAERDREKQELEAVLKDKDEKLTEARNAEVELRKKQRQLDDKIKEVDLEVEKRLALALGPEREKAQKEAAEEQRLRIAEKDQTISALQAKLQEAIRKAEQGSQQLQGEVQELDLERRLREVFPRDTIEPVPKGQHGGDAVHRVLGPQGQTCGTILWESKRTKNWSAAWPDKLKQDQRAARAELGVIVTQAMPQHVDAFAEVDGVWVTNSSLAIPLGAALRLALTEAFVARRAAEGQQDKMAILYQYLTGSQFRQRVEALKDAFVTMQADLTAEQRAITKQWAKRQRQIERVMSATVGMCGDLQAIAGTTLLQIDGLEFEALPEPDGQDGDGA